MPQLVVHVRLIKLFMNVVNLSSCYLKVQTIQNTKTYLRNTVVLVIPRTQSIKGDKSYQKLCITSGTYQKSRYSATVF